MPAIRSRASKVGRDLPFADYRLGVPIESLNGSDLAAWQKHAGNRAANWTKATGFAAKDGEVCFLPNPQGNLARVLVGRGGEPGLWTFAGLPAKLPAAIYRIADDLPAKVARMAALGWALGSYRDDRYRKEPRRQMARLMWPKQLDRAELTRTVEATYLIRDLINTPASDLGPAELAAAARQIAMVHGARCSVIEGRALERDWPSVHAVGKGSVRGPRLIEIKWGRRGPKIALIGKGVCFDSGGYDLKPSANMLTMKKDMGGAAHVLGLAHMIMGAKLPVQLRVMIPAVENMVSGTAYRPLDIIRSKKGTTIEVGNTDAEGRIILCDALYAADLDKPDLIVDFATLTGAARVAVGTDLPAYFCRQDALAGELESAAREERDPVWRLPLWEPYRKQLDGKLADMNNVAGSTFGGAVIAGLFLADFVRPETDWIHLDIMAWNNSTRPGRPEGGEAMAIRAVYALIAERAARK
jgi:leucyl aminopeptidase